MQRQKVQKRMSHRNYFIKRSKMNSEGLRWRIVSLIHIYDMDMSLMTELFSPNTRSVQRWHKIFLSTRSARDGTTILSKYRRPHHFLQYVEAHVKGHPTFYIEELQDHLCAQHHNLKNTSEATICRALNFDLRLTRKKLIKTSREAIPKKSKTAMTS